MSDEEKTREFLEAVDIVYNRMVNVALAREVYRCFGYWPSNEEVEELKGSPDDWTPSQDID